MTRARTKARRLTQAERSGRTRARLLEATIESLVEVGYAKTTTLEVGKRARLPRGTQLHHYPSKAELLVAAVEYLAEKRMRRVQEELRPMSRRTSGKRLDLVLDMLWSSYTGPLFWAALELVVASRTDPELRRRFHAMERRVTRRILTAMEALTGSRTKRAKEVLSLTLYLMNGMAIERISSRDDTERRRLMRRWKATVSTLQRAA